MINKGKEILKMKGQGSGSEGFKCEYPSPSSFSDQDQGETNKPFPKLK
jgi:hypothetical protein